MQAKWKIPGFLSIWPIIYLFGYLLKLYVDIHIIVYQNLFLRGLYKILVVLYYHSDLHNQERNTCLLEKCNNCSQILTKSCLYWHIESMENKICQSQLARLYFTAGTYTNIWYCLQVLILLMIFRQIFIFVVDGVVFVINVGVNDVNADCVDVYDDVDVN